MNIRLRRQGDGNEDLVSTPRLPFWIIAIIGYLAVAAYMVWLGRDQINPDGMAHIQNARHYANGRFELAVNSWWAPMVSWILVPSVWMKLSPVLVVKILGVFFGLFFAAATTSILREANESKLCYLGFLAALMLALIMLPAPITSDLLLTCLITWYLARSLRLLHENSLSYAFTTGLLGGVCYLTKSYALVFVMVHLCLTFSMRLLLIPESAARRQTGKLFLIATGGLLIAASPWIVIISVHDGAPTISSKGRIARIASPVYVKDRPLRKNNLQLPRAGRLILDENPAEDPYYRQPTWSPFDGLRGLKYQSVAVFRNGIRAIEYLKKAEPCGLLVCGWVVAVLLICTHNLSTRQAAFRLWASVSVALYIGGYVLVHVASDRYLWPVWGILLALSLHVFSYVSGCTISKGSESATAKNRANTAIKLCIASLFLLNMAYNILVRIDMWHGPTGETSKAMWLKEVAREIDIQGQVCSNHRHSALSVSYWTQTVFLGTFAGSSAGDVTTELTPFGKTFVLVFDDDDLAIELDTSSHFTKRCALRNAQGSGSVWAFEFDPLRRNSKGSIQLAK